MAYIRAVATHSFVPVEPEDIGFRKGDVLTILAKVLGVNQSNFLASFRMKDGGLLSYQTVSEETYLPTTCRKFRRQVCPKDFW